MGEHNSTNNNDNSNSNSNTSKILRKSKMRPLLQKHAKNSTNEQRIQRKQGNNTMQRKLGKDI